MGVSYKATLVYGIPISYDLLFTQTGSVRRCSRGHEGEKGAFCGTCGQPVSDKGIYKPLKAFTALALEEGHDDAGSYYDSLCEAYEEGSFGIHKTDGYSESFNDSPHVLGWALARTRNPYEGGESPTINPEKDLAEKRTRLHELHSLLGLPEACEPELYLVMHMG